METNDVFDFEADYGLTVVEDEDTEKVSEAAAQPEDKAPKETKEKIESEAAKPPKTNISDTNQVDFEDSESDEGVFTSLAKDFFEHNGLEWSDDLLKEDSAEGFNELLTELIEANSVPRYSYQDSADFDEFLRSGGDPITFFEKYYNRGNTISPDLDLEDVNNQKAVLRENYRHTTKWSEERIEKEIRKLERDEELEDEAKEAFKEVLEIHEKTQKELVEQQKKEAAKRAAEQKQYVENIISLIDKGTAKELGADLSKLEKDKFKAYIFNRDSEGLTGYDRDLRTIPNADIKLALLMFQKITEGKIPAKAAKEANNNLLTKLRKNTNVFSGTKINPDSKDTNGLELFD